MLSHTLTRIRLAVAALLTATGVVMAPLSPRPVLLAQQGAGYATTGEYVREAIEPPLGLPDTRVAAIAQTNDGYLWLGTRRGLVRFDGRGATVFSPQTTRELKSWVINALFADPSGSLWISTDRGLTVYEGGRFRHVPAAQIPESVVWEVYLDSRNRLWVSGSFGVRVGDGMRFRAVPNFDAHIYTVVEDRQQRMWFGGRDVLASYVEGDSTPVRWAGSDAQRVYDLAVDRGGSLWVGLREGMRQLDITDRTRITERRRVSTASSAGRAQVWSLDITPDGTIWMGTDTRGVLRWEGDSLRELDATVARPSDPVWWVTHDSRGNIWAGTSIGLVRYRRTIFRTVTSGLSLPGRAWAIRGDRDDTPWLSTEDGQVAWFDGARWHPIFKRLVNQPAASLWPLARGGMLIATNEGRLWRATRTALDDVKESVGLPQIAAYGLFEDPDGSVYNNTRRGLLRARDGRTDSVYRQLGLSSDDTPRVIMRNSRGALVVGDPYLTIGEGAARKRYGPEEGLTDESIMAMHEAGGALWIATADSGLFALHGERIVSYRRANLLLDREINGIIDDGLGFLWLTSRTGLMRVSIADLLAYGRDSERQVAVRQFDRADGLPTTDFNSDYQSQLYRDARGRIWLPAYAGPVVFDPAAVVEDTIPPQVHVESASIDGAVQARRDSVWASRHPGRVEVNFAATNAIVPTRVRAQYRVVGISEQWIDAGQRRTLSFGPLAGGDYRLEIRVAGEDGSWQPRLAVMHLSVPRSITERTWFVPLLVLSIAAGAFGFTRWRLASARAREMELSRLVSQRTADLEASRADLEVRVAERTDALSRELGERYRLEQRLESTRRMASLGRLAGGVSHEINNALATVLGFAQLAQLASRDDERVHADLAEVVRAGRRAASITHQLLAFARQHHTALTRTRLDDLVRENLRSLEQLCAPLAVHLTCEAGLPGVDADVGQVEQLLVNLVKNARDAKPADGRITITLESRTLPVAQAVGDRVLPAGRFVVLSVHDRGSGITTDVADQLFEPFFTTKQVNEGSGLGLAVVQGIVARHDGGIEVQSAPGEGTTFRVWFPEHAGMRTVDTTEREITGSGETILLAEDDASIRQFATRMLRDHGYRVLDAEDGAAAIALVGKSIEAIDLVVTDVLMPNANGLDLARLMRAARPELPVLFMTGYAGLDQVALDELRATGPVLAKPFTQEALLQAVGRALEGSESAVPVADATAV